MCVYFLMLAGLLVFCSPITPAKPNQDGSSDRQPNRNTAQTENSLTASYISVQKAFCSADKQLYSAEIVGYTS